MDFQKRKFLELLLVIWYIRGVAFLLIPFPLIGNEQTDRCFMSQYSARVLHARLSPLPHPNTGTFLLCRLVRGFLEFGFGTDSFGVCGLYVFGLDGFISKASRTEMSEKICKTTKLDTYDGIIQMFSMALRVDVSGHLLQGSG